MLRPKDPARHFYGLDSETKEVIPFETEEAWKEWHYPNIAKRQLFRDVVGRFTVETTFHGIDLSFGYDLKPAIFETLVLEGEGKKDGKRYDLYLKAVKGHKNLVRRFASPRRQAA
jgi:hypothetical protein